MKTQKVSLSEFTLMFLKHFGILMLTLCAFLISTGLAQAQAPQRDGLIPHFPRKPGLPQIPHRLRAPAKRVPATASGEIIWTTCPLDAEALDPAVSCGYVPVPLDWKHSKREKINIYFELYPHTNPGPAESAILFNIGGPGSTTTGLRWGWVLIFSANMDAHDLLLVDDRGRGLSVTIACPELDRITDTQFINTNDTALWDPAVADCAVQLGDAASRYGTGEVGQDTEAVRAALGYNKVDYMGVSWGGVDVTAYATRFGEHLRSIVLDAPVGTPRLRQFAAERYRTHAEPRMVRLVCQRSPTCFADHPNPDAALDWLIKAIRRDPLEGDAYDADGNLRHVRIDEETLLYYVIDNPTGDFTSTGELVASAESLKQGDRTPLLRLGAEGSFRAVGEDPTFFSEGDDRAVMCIDTHQPWDWSEPVSEREEQYNEAVEELPSHYFAPFSKAAATGLLHSLYSRRCLWWEKPTPSSPVVPPHATYPAVPTLVLTGDIDAVVPLEETTKVAALFPNSTFVKLTEVGHAGIQWSQCARKLESHFLETLHPGDISCARTPEVVWPAVGRFPLRAEQARPAEVDPNGQNQIGVAERKVVTVAVAAAIDALQRSIIGFGNGVGLRGGTFHTDYGDGSVWTTTLSNCAFAKDVTVNGTVTWHYSSVWYYSGTLVADLTVSGSGTAGGTLHIEGTWEAPGPVGNFNVSGKLGGQQVAVLVPEA